MMPCLHLRPGVWVRLKQQPPHLPDFVVMHCRCDRAWIRQPNWPGHIQLCVRVTQLAMPATTARISPGEAGGQPPARLSESTVGSAVGSVKEANDSC